MRSAHKSFGSPFHLLVCLLSLGIASSIPVMAQTTAPAPLPPAAQEAFDNGIIAAKVPDFLLAIRYFEEARKIAPDAPAIYFNLGVAESKIPTHELRAIAWFGAYLAAYPAAPNAAAVKAEIATLEVKSQSNTSRFIQVVKESANQLPEYEKAIPGGATAHLKNGALRQVAALWAMAGDVTAAINTVALTGSDTRADGYSLVAELLADHGDVGGARRTAALIEDPQTREKARTLLEEVGAKRAVAAASVSRGSEVSDWLAELGIYNAYGSTPASVSSRDLNTAIFLDLANHLKSLNASLDEQVAKEESQAEIFRRSRGEIAFDNLEETAVTMVKKQNYIHQLLKHLPGK